VDTTPYSPKESNDSDIKNGELASYDLVGSKVMRNFARLISNVGSPPIVAFVAVLISVYTPPKTGLTWVSMAFVFIAVILPIFYVVDLVRRGKVTDFHLPVRQERIGPFFVTFITGIIGWALVLWLDSPHALKLVALINVIQTTMLMLITTQWKISIHNTAITGLAVLAIYLLGGAALPIILLIPLIGWSRVYLKRHSIEQVIGGTILGLVLVLGAIFYYGLPA